MKKDKKGYLKTNPFGYQSAKNGRVFLFWEGKQVKILSGKQADNFNAKAATLNEEDLQHYLARLTGNFKRGNERS